MKALAGLFVGIGLVVGCATAPTFERSVGIAVADKFLVPKELEGSSLTTTLKGELDASGRWTALSIKQSSGNSKFDAIAIGAAKEAQPFTVPMNQVGKEILLELRPSRP